MHHKSMSLKSSLRFSVSPIKRTLQNLAFMGGEWIGAEAPQFAVQDPATGNRIAQVPDLTEAHAGQAVESAAKAFKLWKKSPPRDRADLLYRWHDLIQQEKDRLANLITLESGKPITEALAEVQYGASYMQWFGEEATRIYGDYIPTPNDPQNRRLVVMKQPVGVCSLITPWNFPLAMVTRKLAPALAAGCTAVIKPAHETPLTCLALMELGTRAGLAPGVANVITTKTHVKDVGHVMATHPLVRKISFTGSTQVGKLLATQACGTLKRVSLELGGNAPFIVFEDADLEKAADGLLQAKFRNSGQTCVAANRVYVHKNVMESFGQVLSDRVKNLRMGHGGSPQTQIGPLISEKAKLKVQQHVDDAIANGAKLLLGGTASDGFFFEPTVLINVIPDSKMNHEETFGPVIGIQMFSSEDEVISLANNSDAGLAGYFYSENISRIFRVADALEVGMVGVNQGLISTEIAPFGGIKDSGVGREGSRYGIQEYVDIKYVCLGA